MKSLKLALDWTPNINHIGFFVAQSEGFYKKQGLDVSIVDPSTDNYQVTPAKKVEKGLADFTLCPTESVLSYRTKQSPFPLTAVAAILQDDLSALVVKTNSNITSPKDLDTKTYASYKARYEDEIVKQMIRNDGGEGAIAVVYPEKLGTWDTLTNDTYDATWVFLNWEGVQVHRDSSNFTYFKMADYKIPYSYSPVLVVDQNKIASKKTEYTSFLKATAQGYKFCKENPNTAVAILASVLPEKDKNIDLLQALNLSLDAFQVGPSWGTMKEEVIASFLNWLYRSGLETHQLEASSIFTNELL